MIAVITMQSVDGDCPSNITVDTEKLKAIKVSDCMEKYKDVKHWDEDKKLKFATDDFLDAQKYAGMIEGTIPDADHDENPGGWSILEKAEVKLPQTVDWTGVIFYG